MWQTLGHSKIKDFFEKSLIQESLSHAYLLVGPPHIGKTTMAYDIARAINCTGEAPPCGECASCQRTTRHIHSDVISIGLESSEDNRQTSSKNKTEIGIDEIKMLQQLASLPPYESSNKIFIINGVDHLSQEAANCILKTLEEPSPHVILILLASKQTAVLPTIISRCQIVHFKPLPERFLESLLIDKYEVEPVRAQLLSRLSEGCPGYAISALSDDKIFSQRSAIIEEMAILIESNMSEKLSYIARLDSSYRNAEWKNMAELSINTWISWWHDIMLIMNSCNDSITNVDYKEDLEKYSKAFIITEIKNYIVLLNKSLELISKNANIRLVLEVLMLNMPQGQKSE